MVQTKLNLSLRYALVSEIHGITSTPVKFAILQRMPKLTTEQTFTISHSLELCLISGLTVATDDAIYTSGSTLPSPNTIPVTLTLTP